MLAEQWELRGFDKSASETDSFYAAVFQWGRLENAGVHDGKLVLRFGSVLESPTNPE